MSSGKSFLPVPTYRIQMPLNAYRIDPEKWPMIFANFGIRREYA